MITLISPLCNESFFSFFFFFFELCKQNGAAKVSPPSRGVFSLERLLFILTGSAKTNAAFIKDPKLDIFVLLAFVFYRPRRRVGAECELHNEL